VLDKERQSAPGLRVADACDSHVVPGNLGGSPDLAAVVLDGRAVIHRPDCFRPSAASALSTQRVRVLDLVLIEEEEGFAVVGCSGSRRRDRLARLGVVSCASPVNRYAGLISHDPGVVAGRDGNDVAGANLGF
jgi:hypothetical protein